MIGYTKDTPLNLWFIHYVNSLVVCSQRVDPHGRITLPTVTTSHRLAQHWFRGPGSGTWHCFHYFNTESILYQLNQSVGHRSHVTGLLNLTKSHSSHTKNHQKFKKGSKIEKFYNIVNWRNHNFIRQVTGHTGWRIDLIINCYSIWSDAWPRFTSPLSRPNHNERKWNSYSYNLLIDHFIDLYNWRTHGWRYPQRCRPKQYRFSPGKQIKV